MHQNIKIKKGKEIKARTFLLDKRDSETRKLKMNDSGINPKQEKNKQLFINDTNKITNQI